MVNIRLNSHEMEILKLQNPSTSHDGGFQSLLVSLQKKMTTNGDLELSVGDLERIPRYAYDYGNGGWENRLEAIFARSLGKKLGR